MAENSISFMVGDIVKITYSYGVEYHLVYDVAYVENTEVQSHIETIVIFPVDEDPEDDAFFFDDPTDKDMILDSTVVSNVFADDDNIIMKNINRTRNKSGYYEIPNISEIRKWKKGLEKEPKKIEKTYKEFPQVQDIIRYDELPSVNECLDAINDLKALHNIFGDEAYIQLGELVTKKIDGAIWWKFKVREVIIKWEKTM